MKWLVIIQNRCWHLDLHPPTAGTPCRVGVARRKAAAGNTCCCVITPRQTDTPSQPEQREPDPLYRPLHAFSSWMFCVCRPASSRRRSLRKSRTRWKTIKEKFDRSHCCQKRNNFELFDWNFSCLKWMKI